MVEKENLAAASEAEQAQDHNETVSVSEDARPTIRVERQAYRQKDFNEHYAYKRPEETGVGRRVKETLRENCQCRPKKVLFSLLPVLKWLPEYSWKDDIVSDLISGFTVAVMHIPQGMAYAMLAAVPPIIGIYMGFFPVLVYFFMGTSRHVSMGSFAVICLMTGKIVTMHSSENSPDLPLNNSTENVTTASPVPVPADFYTAIQVGAAVSLLVGLWQILMGIFRLGVLSLIISDVLVSGFTTGASMHVFTSQVKNLLGVSVKRYNGPLKLAYTYIDIFTEIGHSNVAAIIVSIITIAVLVINNELLKPRVAKKIPFPIPIELIAVVAGTLASTYGYFQTNYDMDVVGDIPTGLPLPRTPPPSLLPVLIVDSLVVAIVAYAISLSMARIFAQKLNYEIDANQELLASGTANVVGAFFSSIPIAASLSRSLIQEAVGGKTQLASIVSCSLLLIVLLWIGPFFEALPSCVLSSIIVVALKGMFLQFLHLKTFWKKSKIDGFIWISTFLMVVVLDIDYGLFIGIGISLCSLLYHSQVAYTCLLGVVPGTDVYLDADRYKSVEKFPTLKIVHFAGGLHFANGEYFKSEVSRLVGLDPQRVLIVRKKTEAKAKKAQTLAEKKEKISGTVNLDGKSVELGIVVGMSDNEVQENRVRHVILDFSALSFVDSSGVKHIATTIQDYNKVDIPVFIAGCSGPVSEMMERCAFYKDVPASNLFPTVHDAVQYILKDEEPEVAVL